MTRAEGIMNQSKFFRYARDEGRRMSQLKSFRRAHHMGRRPREQFKFLRRAHDVEQRPVEPVQVLFRVPMTRGDRLINQFEFFLRAYDEGATIAFISSSFFGGPMTRATAE